MFTFQFLNDKIVQNTNFAKLPVPNGIFVNFIIQKLKSFPNIPGLGMLGIVLTNLSNIVKTSPHILIHSCGSAYLDEE